MTRVAIIGAGMAGLALARRLRDRCEVTVFEKSRGVGGRMATRYADPYQFDHGAQYFTAKTKAFRDFLKPMLESGLVKTWRPIVLRVDRDGSRETEQWGDATPHYVAVPRMNALCKMMAEYETVHLQTRIRTLARQDCKWQLIDEGAQHFEGFDWVISTAPAAQTADLMPETFKHHGPLADISMQACHTLMVGYERPLELPWQAARIAGTDISWIAVNSSKAGRPDRFSMVIHADNRWSDAHIDDDLDNCRDHLLSVASRNVGHDLHGADHIVFHRWRYALAGKQSHMALVDEDLHLGACGDWCVEGRVEGAFTSAVSLHEKIIGLLPGRAACFRSIQPRRKDRHV